MSTESKSVMRRLAEQKRVSTAEERVDRRERLTDRREIVANLERIITELRNNVSTRDAEIVRLSAESLDARNAALEEAAKAIHCAQCTTHQLPLRPDGRFHITEAGQKLFCQRYPIRDLITTPKTCKFHSKTDCGVCGAYGEKE